MNTLTQEQVNDLLREHTCFHVWKSLSSGITSSMTREDVDDFANAAFALGVAQEREACAKICEALEITAHKDWKAKYELHDQGRSEGAGECVEAIRARK